MSISRSMSSAGVLAEVVMLTAWLILGIRSKTSLGLDSNVGGGIKRGHDAKV